MSGSALPIKVEKPTSGIGRIWLANPKKLNALTVEMLAGIAAALSDFSRDPLCSCVILGAEGRSFSAGFDISAQAMPREATEWPERFRTASELFSAIWTTPVPLVVEVQGHCLGGALDLALAGDILIASEDAEFGLPEVTNGSTDMFFALPFVVPGATARALLSGIHLRGAEAVAKGLAFQVTTGSELRSVGFERARQLARVPKATYSQNKKMLAEVWQSGGWATAIGASWRLASVQKLAPDAAQQTFDSRVRDGGVSAATRAKLVG